MKASARFVILLVWVSMLVMPAQPQTSHPHSDNATGSPEWSAFSATMQDMHTAMASVTPSGDNDVDFVRLMLPHHQAALDMAKTQLLQGKDPQLRRLAQEIIADQQSEIQLMQLWLRQHEASSTKPDQPLALNASRKHSR